MNRMEFKRVKYTVYANDLWRLPCITIYEVLYSQLSAYCNNEEPDLNKTRAGEPLLEDYYEQLKTGFVISHHVSMNFIHFYAQ